jgi:hypothetical protein
MKHLKIFENSELKILENFTGNWVVSVCLGTIVQNPGMRKLGLT